MPKGKSNRPTLEDFRRELARAEGEQAGLKAAGGDTQRVAERIELLTWAIGSGAAPVPTTAAPSASDSAQA